MVETMLGTGTKVTTSNTNYANFDGNVRGHGLGTGREGFYAGRKWNTRKMKKKINLLTLDKFLNLLQHLIPPELNLSWLPFILELQLLSTGFTICFNYFPWNNQILLPKSCSSHLTINH